MSNSISNWYHILGITPQADAAQIKQAYRKLAKQYHPDRNQGSAAAEQRFKQIQQAYETLGDEQSRKRYDESLQSKTSESRQSNTTTASHERSGTMARPDFDPRNVQAQFERFFGFNANGQKKEDTDRKTSKNPLDTSTIFDRYFGPRP
ncbi:J domain-containing protein [Paenibacillus wenxiniae]|uniref:J domain-containing protein n=1 Tax=Paenibacillus wenxiniae TaxID=1636843 RepID=A0ABW4RFZ6_9BACL